MTEEYKKEAGQQEEEAPLAQQEDVNMQKSALFAAPLDEEDEEDRVLDEKIQQAVVGAPNEHSHQHHHKVKKAWPDRFMFVRHAQSFGNLGGEYVSMRDSGLTAKGERQSDDFDGRFSQEFEDPELVVASPMRRTVQTALRAFNSSLSAGTSRFVVHPGISEVSSKPVASIWGTPPSEWNKEWFGAGHEFALAQPFSGFPSLKDQTMWQESQHDMHKAFSMIKAGEDGTVNKFWRWLENQPAKRIAIVTHANILRQRFTKHTEGDWFPNYCEIEFREGPSGLKQVVPNAKKFQQKSGKSSGPRKVVVRRVKAP